MEISHAIQKQINELKKDFDTLKAGKESLLQILSESELPESVYNSNAIENSTLTLSETEKVLLDMEVSKDHSVREIFEAKNLARVSEYVRAKKENLVLNKDTILLLHNLLIGAIDDSIAGRFRKAGEYVRVGTHIAPGPEHVERMIEVLLHEYAADHTSYIIDKIAKFHLDFENIHPFNDGNGRIGRVLINAQLQMFGYPPIIIRDKEKQVYYTSFATYREKNSAKDMAKVISLALRESLHKRLTYLRGEQIIKLSDYAKKHEVSSAGLINAGRRQTIPAFREKGCVEDKCEF
jgi:Fic family protein